MDCSGCACLLRASTHYALSQLAGQRGGVSGRTDELSGEERFSAPREQGTDG
jgi:hypothetical protein